MAGDSSTRRGCIPNKAFSGISLMRKKAYTLQMSYDLSDTEKAEAEKSLLVFDHLIRAINKATDHVYVMLTPFKNDPSISSDEVIKYRAALRRFRDKMIENFDSVKEVAFECIKSLKPFSNDTQTDKLSKSFISSIDDIETKVNKFAETFDNLKDDNFIASAVAALGEIEDQADQTKQLVEDRIKTHIQKDILGKTWMDGVSDALQTSIETKTPKLIELSEERDKQLEDLAHNNHPIQNWQG
jgi:hypothetical protein